MSSKETLINEETLSLCGISAESRVLCAFSGGSDSTALLLELNRLFLSGKIGSLAAAHFNHGLRGEEGDADSRFCKALTVDLNISLYIGSGDVRAEAESSHLSEESAARSLRYSFLCQTALKGGFDCIALAHHSLDQAETVLMHLLRGCGSNGLGGMRPRNGIFVRPFLGINKESILKYLLDNGQSFRTDSTNFDLISDRNRLRLSVFPLLEEIYPGATARICSAAEKIRSENAFLDSMASDIYRRCGGSRTAINREQPVIRNRILLLMLKKYTNDYSETDVKRMCTLLSGRSGRSVNLTGGFTARSEGDFIRFFQSMTEFPESVLSETEPFVFAGSSLRMERVSEAIIPCASSEAYLDADKISFPLSVRSFLPGERFTPLGMNNAKLFSDFFTDKKISLSERSCPIVYDRCGAIYVAGFTIDDRVKVTDKSHNIVHFIYEKGDSNE